MGMSLMTFIRRYGAAGWRYRWAALGLAWVICIGGWIAVSMIPNVYESSARLFVDADAVLTPLLRGLAIDNTPANEVEVLQRTLLSRPNLEKVVQKTDLDTMATDPVARDRQLAGLATSIQIQAQTRNLFQIQYRNPNPRLAQSVVQTVLALFIDNAMGKDRQDISNARTFLQAQIDSYEAKLREAENRRATFLSKYAELLPSADGGTSRLDSQRTAVITLQGQLIDASARRDRLQQELAATPQMVSTGTVGGTPASGGGQSPELAAAERNLADLRLRFTDQHPDVIAAKKLVATLRAGGGGAAASPGTPARQISAPNPIFDQLKLQLVDADSQVASLQRQVSEAERERDRIEKIARGAPEVQAQYTNINRDYDVLRKNYDELLARREALRISTAANSDSDKVTLQVIDPPTLPRVPVAPKRVLMMAGVLVAGIGGGIGVALLLAQLDGSFYSTHDLRKLGLPVLGGVSIATAAAIPRRAIGLAGFAAGIALLVIAFGGFVGGHALLARLV